MPTANYLPNRFPTDNVDAATVANTATVELSRMNTSLRQAGGAVAAGRTVTVSTYVASTDGYLRADTTGGAITLTLPRVAEYTRMVVVIARSAGANTLTVAARGTDTIAGGASVTVTKATTFTPDTNANWTLAMVSA